MVKLSDLRRRHLDGHNVGTIRQLGHTDIRPNELMPFGQEVPIADYPEFYAKHGPNKFGVASSPFLMKLPDLRGVCLMNLDKVGGKSAYRVTNVGAGNPGIDARVIGARGGVDRRTLQFADLPAGVLTLLSDAGLINATPSTAGTGGAPLYKTPVPTAYSNMPPVVVVNFAIHMGRDVVVYRPSPVPAPTGEEFNGPFDDWIDVVRDFGADPTGVEDSTQAIQNAINAACGISDDVVPNGFELGSNDNYATHYLSKTVWIPAGEYKITEPIRVGDSRRVHKSNGAYGISIFGEHPDTTVLKWAGSDAEDSDSNIMWMAGMHDGIISRLTFDGQTTCFIGLRLERDFDVPMNQSYNRIEWCFFKDCARGFANTDDISGASTDSETSLYGCRFIRCTDYGSTGKAAEAYDYWHRACYFEECGIAVGQSLREYLETFEEAVYEDRSKEGNWHFTVYDCIFNGSKLWDIHAIGYNASVIGNTSVNSFRFLKTKGGSGTVGANRIINPFNTDCIHAISQYDGIASNRGNTLYAMNEFHLKDGAVGPVYVELHGETDFLYSRETLPIADPRWSSTTLSFWGNKFNVSYTDVYGVDLTKNYFLNGSDEPQHYFDHESLFGQTIDASVPDLLTVPPNVVRPIFYLNLTDPQSTVDAASAAVDEDVNANPVVYVPMLYDGWRMEFSHTLVFPANKHMTLQGGGRYAHIDWSRAGSNSHDPHVPVLLFRGPTKCKMKYVHVLDGGEGGKTGVSIIVDNCDQVGSRVILDNWNGIISVTASHTKVSINESLLGTNNYKLAPSEFRINGEAGDGYTIIEGCGTGQGDWNKNASIGYYMAGMVVANRVTVLDETTADDFIVGKKVRYDGHGSGDIGGIASGEDYYIVSVADFAIGLSATEGGSPIALTDAVTGSWHTFSITVPPRENPLIAVHGGARLIVRNMWNESTSFQKLDYYMTGSDAAQRGFFAMDGTRSTDTTPDPLTENFMTKIDGWKGDLVNGVPGRGILRGAYDLSYMGFGNSAAAFWDDGNVLNTYDGEILKVFKGVAADSQISDIPSTYDDDLAAFRNLPGYPDAYDGDVGDYYITLDDLHWWAWDGTAWVDVLGWVGTVGKASRLPGYPDAYESGLLSPGSFWKYLKATDTFVDSGYDASGDTYNRPKVGDTFLVLETMSLWKWTGSAWTELAGANMPNEYFCFSSSYPYGGAALSGSWQRHKAKWISRPWGIHGSLPTNSEAMMARFVTTRPFLTPVSNAEGVTDFAIRWGKADIVIMADVFDLPA